MASSTCNANLHAVTFALDGQRYALDLSVVQFVVRAVEITPLPRAPDCVAGIINVRGQVVPVFNLRRRFRLPERDLQLDDHFILARTARRGVALVVDAVGGVMECSAAETVPADAVLPETEYVAGVVKQPDGLVLIHDLNTFLSLDEEQALAARAGTGMNHEISNLLLAQFSEFIAAHMGLHFPAERWPDLRRGIRSAAPEFGHTSETACVECLMSAPLTRHQIEILAGNLTVGETYFFREKRVFEVLTERILPELIQSRRGGERHLRFWSAACCTGEEAYSLAITMRRAIPDLKGWQVTILATDVNSRFLQKAATGVFGEWSFRDAPAWLKEQYFQRVEGNRYAILPEIRQMVQFEHLNLAEDTCPSLLTDTNAMDVIFCRNVLMYFAPSRAQRVIAQLHRCLMDGGWLALSATETAIAPSRHFAAVQLDGAILYRKCERPAAPARAPAAPVAGEPPVAEAPRVASPPQVPDAPGMIQLTRELANQGRLAEAQTLADKLVLADKMNPVAHYLRAMIVLEQGALPEAARALQRAVYLDHQFVIAHFALGNLARGAGRMRDADKHFTNVLHLLDRYEQDDLLPESEGMTAGRLAEIVNATREEAAV